MKQNHNKMIERLSLCFLLALIVMANGCAILYKTPVKPPLGIFFCDVKAPLTADLKNVDNSKDIIKTSARKTMFFHDFLLTGTSYAWEKADIPEIARQGGIKEVTYADYQFFHVLGIYAEFTINVYGR